MNNRLVYLVIGIVLVLITIVVPPSDRLGSLKYANYSLIKHTCFYAGLIIGTGSLWGLLLILPIVDELRSISNEMTVAQLLQNISTSTPLIAFPYWAIAFLGGLLLGY